MANGHFSVHPDDESPLMPFGRAMLAEWMLDPEITYLNHGTVGAVPRQVLAAQQAIRDEVERQPSRFLLREYSSRVGHGNGRSLMRQAADRVAAFVGAHGDDLGFTDNATTAINGVMRSLRLEPGDEIVITDSAYGAVARVAAFTARERGAVVRTVALPWPAFDPAVLVERLAAALTDRTRIAIIDHISSETALIQPVVTIAERCRSLGIPVLVDGAHAPGALPLDLPALGVDWYAANLHKWAHAPRSCGFLWAAPDRQRQLHPAVISWGLDQGMAAEFDWVGTRDPSPFLAAPAGIAFLEKLGFDAQRSYNHELAWWAALRLTDRWGTVPGMREHDVGVMATVPIPPVFGETRDDATRLRDQLLFEDRIEAPVIAIGGKLYVRVSAQVYNERDDVERLAEAVARRAGL
jgi:isopenicillin-N epimerase